MRQWCDVRCNYCDDDGFWAVDAWKTPESDENDGENGEVIAYIDNLTARVVYIEPLARLDDLAQEVIKAKVEEINKNNKVLVKVVNGDEVTVYVKTAAGTLIAEAELEHHVGSDNIYVGLRPKGFEDYMDLFGVKTETDAKYFHRCQSTDYEMQLLAFENPYSEDPSWDSWVSDGQIVDAHKEE